MALWVNRKWCSSCGRQKGFLEDKRDWFGIRCCHIVKFKRQKESPFLALPTPFFLFRFLHFKIRFYSFFPFAQHLHRNRFLWCNHRSFSMHQRKRGPWTGNPFRMVAPLLVEIFRRFPSMIDGARWLKIFSATNQLKRKTQSGDRPASFFDRKRQLVVLRRFFNWIVRLFGRKWNFFSELVRIYLMHTRKMISHTLMAYLLKTYKV